VETFFRISGGARRLTDVVTQSDRAATLCDQPLPEPPVLINLHTELSYLRATYSR
jgi:hypothetical protein